MSTAAKSTFYFKSDDGIIGRGTDDQFVLDALMPDGSWRRNVPDVSTLSASEITRGLAQSLADEFVGNKVDLDAEPTEVWDPEAKDFVEFTPEQGLAAA